MLETVISTLTMALISVMIFFYYLRKGQFNHIEDVKYEMFRNSDDEASVRSYCKREDR